MMLAQTATVELVKQFNNSAVYRMIDQEGPISRIQIAEKTQLAPASITKITRQLMEIGIIREQAQQESTGGRRATSLIATKENFLFVAGKISPNSLSLHLYDLEGKEYHAKEFRLEPKPQAELVESIISLLERFIVDSYQSRKHLIAISATVSGLVNPKTGCVQYVRGFDLNNCPLADLISKRLNLPVYLGNHTRAMALAESFYGNAQRCSDSILLSLGSGVGSGIISNHQVLIGDNRDMGELGHIQVDPLGIKCHCGRFGCLETIASNDGILNQVQAQLLQGRASTLSLTNLNLQEFVSAVKAGDRLANDVLIHTSRKIGQVLAIMVNLFNPQKILLQGEITQCLDVILPEIRASLNHQALPTFCDDLTIERAFFQNQPSIGAFGLTTRALFSGDLLQQLLTKPNLMHATA